MVTGERPVSYVDLVVVMPVGPDNSGVDTIESVLHYCTPSVIVLAVDDSRLPETASRLNSIDPRVVRLASSGFPGIRGGLFVSLAAAYRHAVEHYRFQTLLRLDTDALVIGANPEADARAAFDDDPQVGMLGSHRIHADGSERSFKPAVTLISREAGIRGISEFHRWRVLRGWLRDAARHGYELGEHALGAASFQSYACVRAIADAGHLDRAGVMKSSGISEDHLFGILTYATGFGIGDLASGRRPLGISWRGLPDSPNDLVLRGKKIIHSVKNDALPEAEI